MKKLSALLILISLSVFFIFSCQKDKTYEAGESNNLRTTVTGIVLDENNAALTGVTVTAYGQNTTTNQYGTFVLKNINANKDRCVLEFSKTGFFKRAHGFIASANTVNYVRIVLLSNTSSQNFSSSTGGTVSLTDGSSAEFQPNSFVTSDGNAYTGTVNIAIKHLSPDDANFGFMIPGGDLLAKNLNDEDVALYTYGMLGVELTGSSGEALQLAAGGPATLTFSIAASQLSSAPASIPLWYFEETTSLWKEEGSANKIGNNYVGTVAHFSWWNCDIGTNSPYIKGKVIDCDGVPVANCVVTVNGWATTLTNQNGEWQGRVPSGQLLTAQALSSNNGGSILNSQLENIPSLSNNQTFIVPDLVIPCPTRVAGTLKTCSGENTDGFVFISNTSTYFYQYTTSGAFNLPAPENAQMVLYAVNSSNHDYSQSITTLAAPNNLNVGNLMLCNSITMLPNSFVLNGDIFSNQLFIINSTNSTVIVSDSSGNSNIGISIQGSIIPNYAISYYSMNIQDTIPSNTTCAVAMQLYNGTTCYVYAPNISCILTEVGSVGNSIKGSYSGAAQINGILGTISGNFDVIRTQ